MKRIFYLLTVSIVQIAVGQNLTLNGPDKVCPGEEYTFTATTSYWGSFVWYVVEDDQGGNHLPVRCGGGSTSSTYTYTFNENLGDATIYVDFKGGLCLETHTRDKYVQKTVTPPSAPYLADGTLSLCPGVPSTVSITSPQNNFEDCYFHYKWDWQAPPYFSINGNSNTYRGIDQILLMAPVNAQLGYAGQYFLDVQSEPADPYSEARLSRREIWIGEPFVNTTAIDANTSVATNSAQTVFVQAANGARRYEWSIVPFSTSCSPGSTTPPSFTFYGGSTATTSVTQINLSHGTCEGVYRLRCKAKNSCGFDEYVDKVITISSSTGPCPSTLSVYPNPSSLGGVSTLKIAPCATMPDLMMSAKGSYEELSITKVIVLDDSNNLVFERNYHGRQEVNLAGIQHRKGTFYVYAYDNTGYIHKERMIIN